LRRRVIERDGQGLESAELFFASSRKFIFPARVRAGLPGNQLEPGILLGVGF